MHREVRQLIKRVRNEYWYKFRLRKVIDIGSKNINGSARRYFWLCKYIGIDLSKGKGVDIVGEFTKVHFEENSFDVALCLEVLEHCVEWKEVLTKMYSVVKEGGLMIVTAASEDRLEHGTRRTTPFASPDTLDYYKNISKSDFKSILPESLFSAYVLMNARDKQDLQFYGIKK